MERMKIRNPKIKKWRGLLILALIGAIIAVAMEIYLSDHALTPDQISKKGQYCAVTSRWMSDAFATETMNGEDTYDYFLVLSEDSDRFFMIRSWTDDEQCLKSLIPFMRAVNMRKSTRSGPEDRSRWMTR